MTTKKEKKFVQIFLVKDKRISRKVIPYKDFDINNLPKSCCGYRFLTSTTKNGTEDGTKNYVYEKFISINSTIYSKEDLQKNEEVNGALLASMGENYTHIIHFGAWYLVDLS